jgi:dolichyl-phosphate-mannose--protein O-mannosyl transferase
VSFRFVSASISAVIPSAGFMMMRVNGYSRGSSMLASSLLLGESMLVTEGRFILTDGILHSFVVFTLLSLSMVNIRGSSNSKYFTGILVGCSISIRSTSLSLVPVVGYWLWSSLTNSNLLDLFKTDYSEDESTDAYVIFQYVPRFFQNERFQDIVKTQIVIWILGTSVLSASYIAHVNLMKFHGLNDDQMSDRFRKTLLDMISVIGLTRCRLCNE